MSSCCAVMLLLVLSAVLARTAQAQNEIRHVSQCNFCTDCIVGDKPSSLRRMLSSAAQQPDTDVSHALSRAGAHHAGSHAGEGGQHGWSHGLLSSLRKLHVKNTPEENAVLHGGMSANMFLATHTDTVPKQTQPNCTRCYGCNTKLTHMSSEARYFDRTYTNEKGATSSWLFRATTDKMPSGMAVTKLYCVPIPKREGAKVPTCSPMTVLKNMQLLTALEKISEDCGLNDIIPKVWVDRVDAVVPEMGYHIRWHGLWMELIHGVSLENFLHKGSPQRLSPNEVLDILHNKLNKTQVVRAAIFDLLTSQCDRHAQNIFINEDGQIKLIDNEACLQNNWKTCGFDSILIPTTQKNEIVRLSNQFVLKYVTAADAPRMADPQLLFDYRCYIGGADALGTDYPPKVSTCLKKISGMTVAEVQEHYGLPDELPARNLHARATDMITKGFEWAYKFGEPRNAPPKRYLTQPKCCKLMWKEGNYQCAHEWQPIFEVPIGDPVTGREWTKPRPDTGTFEGGTRV